MEEEEDVKFSKQLIAESKFFIFHRTKAITEGLPLMIEIYTHPKGKTNVKILLLDYVIDKELRPMKVYDSDEIFDIKIEMI